MHSRTDLVDTVGTLVALEARTNEYRVSLVRVFAYCLIVAMDVGLFWAGYRPLSNAAISAVLVILAAVLLFLVKTRYQPWFRFFLPVVDAVFILQLLNSRLDAVGLVPHMVAVSALASALFAATGGIRFDRKAALWTIFLALLTLIGSIGWRSWSVPMLYPVCGLAAVGLLSMWLSDLARRTMEGERGRLMLRRFLQTEVVDLAFANPAALVAEPRTVEATMLVSDMRGFTSLAEKLSPVEVMAVLNELQGALAAAVHHHGGVVDKFMGDGMLAVFGATGKEPAHATKAVEAARDILAAVERINQAHPRRQPLRIGIGIHTGQVVAGCMGSGQRLEFTVIGDAVNIASRLEALTKELRTQVLISAETAMRVSSPLHELGEVSVRGRSGPIRVLTLSAPEVAVAS